MNEKKRIRNTRNSLHEKIRKVALIKKLNERTKQITKKNAPRNRRHLTPKVPGRALKELSEIIFLTGGVGDIFAVESFLSDEQRSKIQTIVYATRKYKPIRRLFASKLPNYPNLKNHVVAWDDFSNFWCFFHKIECVNRIKNAGLNVPDVLLQARDLSISPLFQAWQHVEPPTHASSFLKYPVADINRLSLPQQYITICPYSNDKSNRNRDFDSKDWDYLLRYLRRNSLRGVVLNDSAEFVPQDHALINLSQQTDIVEGVEVLKRSNGYIGIDSAFSVLAAQLFSWPHLNIKCVNGHGLNFKKIYYAPHREFQFIGSSIESLTEKLN